VTAGKGRVTAGKGQGARGNAEAVLREGQTFSGRSPLVTWANFVKLPHTVFALPFAIVGVVLASYHAPVEWNTVLWVILAFTAARFAAMGFNRIVDRDIDARNPRTKAREIPSGVISVGSARVAVAVASAVFLVAAWRLNPLCLALAPVALVWIFFYSYTKRFTAGAHLVLGLGLGIAPVGGYLAVAGAWPTPWWGLVVLASAVMMWVAGFDVLYSLQDIDVDRSQGLRSIPATLGIGGAINAARILHVSSVGLLALAGSVLSPTPGWTVGTVVVAALLLWEHRLVRRDDLSRLNAAFFTMNGVMSLLFCAVVLAERLW
jgi:4-hydroxybenzoate polyprenyltransferase